jgi:hypothetical protein
MSEAAWDELGDDATEKKPPRKAVRGKPRRHDPNINWALAERLYVEGELVGDAEHCRRVYPRLADIARRSGTTPSNLTQHAWRFYWRDKKTAFQVANSIIPVVNKSEEPPPPPPKPARPLRRDPETVLRAYIDLMAEAVEKRTIRHDSIVDLDKAIRLLAFVRGQAEHRSEVRAVVSLDVIAQRHRQFRDRVATRFDNEVAGVLGGGSPSADVAADAGEHEDDAPWAAIDAEGEAVADVEPADAPDPFEL